MPAVLIADDEPMTRRLLEMALKKHEFAVTAVENGRACLAALAAGLKPAVVLLDFMMPDMGGIDVLKELRASGQIGGDTGLTVVMLTGVKQLSGLREALRLGATDYLSKPFAPRVVCARVRELAFQPTPLALRAVLAQLGPEDAQLRQAPGLGAVAAGRTLFAADFEGMSYRIAIPTHLTAAALMAGSDADLQAHVDVYVRKLEVWQLAAMSRVSAAA